VTVLRIGSARAISFSGTRFEASVAWGYQHARLRAAMRRGGFDVVHVHTPWAPLLSIQAFACGPGAKVVTFHDTPPDTVGGAISKTILRGLSRLLLPHVDEAIAVSEAPRAHLWAPRAQFISITPPCTDLRRFAAATGPAVQRPKVSLLFVGRLEPRKGVSVLLKAYRRLCEEGLPVTLTIAGGGAEEALLRRYVERHSLPDVRFLGGFDDAHATALYGACDIVCAPSPYGESFGIVIAEAMAAGKPVVAAANRGYRTLLQAHADELLAPPGDAEGFADRLRRLVLDGELRARLGAWGRTEARRYDCRTVAPDLVATYRRAMGQTAAASTPEEDLAEAA
jgi:phosphatidylinositol alpha-mannosyltransferase